MRDEMVWACVMMEIFWAVLDGKSSSWYMKEGRVGAWYCRRKKRVSEPAPREMICFTVGEGEQRKRWTRLSIALVRTYVPGPIYQL